MTYPLFGFRNIYIYADIYLCIFIIFLCVHMYTNIMLLALRSGSLVSQRCGLARGACGVAAALAGQQGLERRPSKSERPKVPFKGLL